MNLLFAIILAAVIVYLAACFKVHMVVEPTLNAKSILELCLA